MSSTDSKPDPFGGRSAYRVMALGSAWLVGMRWCVRGMGLLSTLVLARLLAPEAFGIVAVAMVLAGLVEALAETGQRLALLRLPDPGRAEYDTAWTLGILVGLVVGGVLFALSWPAAAFVGDPRVVPVIQVLALKPVIAGLENIGTVDFQRRFEFGRDFRFGVATKLASVFVGVGAAVVFRSHWALVAGILAATLSRTVWSFILSDYRPRLSLAAWRALTAFSLWTLGTQLARFAAEKTDRAVAGAGGGTPGLGLYSVASEIAAAFLVEIVMPVARALMPVYARLQHDRAELAAKYRTVLAALGHLCLSIAVGLALVADHAVPVLLGDGWSGAAPLLAWLALASGMQLLAGSVTTVLNAVGQARRAAVLAWAQLLALVPALLAGFHWGGIEGMAAARAGVAVLFVPMGLWGVRRCLGLGFPTLLGSLARPLLASAAMTAMLVGLDPAASLAHPLPGLAAEVCLGAMTYAAAALLAWLLSGRPEGPESLVLGLLARRVRRVAVPSA